MTFSGEIRHYILDYISWRGWSMQFLQLPLKLSGCGAPMDLFSAAGDPALSHIRYLLDTIGTYRENSSSLCSFLTPDKSQPPWWRPTLFRAWPIVTTAGQWGNDEQFCWLSNGCIISSIVIKCTMLCTMSSKTVRSAHTRL